MSSKKRLQGESGRSLCHKLLGGGIIWGGMWGGSRLIVVGAYTVEAFGKWAGGGKNLSHKLNNKKEDQGAL